MWHPSVQDVAILDGLDGSVCNLHWLRDGTHVVAGATTRSPGKILVWNAATREVVRRLTPDGVVEALVGSRMHNLVVVAIRTAKKAVRIVAWNFANPRKPRLLWRKTVGSSGKEAFALAISADTTRVAVTNGAESVHVFRRVPEKGVVDHRARTFGRLVTTVGFLDPEGRRLVVGGVGDGGKSELGLWNTDQGDAATFDRSIGHVRAITIHPQRHLVAAACQDDSVRLYTFPNDYSELTLHRVIRGKDERFWSVVFHPTEDRMFTGTRTGAVTIWDTSTFEPILTLPAHIGKVMDLALDPTGTHLGSASSGFGGLDNVVKIWSAGPSPSLIAMRQRFAPK